MLNFKLTAYYSNQWSVHYKISILCLTVEQGSKWFQERPHKANIDKDTDATTISIDSSYNGNMD